MKFAAIGHQDSWTQVQNLVNFSRREEGNSPLELDSIKDIYTYFPPMKLFDVKMNSPISEAVEGMYIESFISPDELDRSHLYQNVQKVEKACEKAHMLGADIVALGGFCSILLELSNSQMLRKFTTSFTTGNTLTAAFIVKSMETTIRKRLNKDLSDCRILIIGSTGDIGQACVAYFKDKVDELILNARQKGPLKSQCDAINGQGFTCSVQMDLADLSINPDAIICVASSSIEYSMLKQQTQPVIICDAGYPKNLPDIRDQSGSQVVVYEGGMGQVSGGFEFYPSNYHQAIYDFPIEYVCHGCILEAVVLAMEDRNDPYSHGKGNITPDAMNEIYQMAERHGIVPAVLDPATKTKGKII